MLCLASFPSGLLLCQDDKSLRFLRCIKQTENMRAYHHRHRHVGSRSAEKWRVPPCDFVPSCFCQAVAVRADVVSGHSPPPRGVKPVCSACPGCQGRGQAWQGRPSSRRLRARLGGGPTTSIPGVPVFSIPGSSEEAVGPRRPPPPSAAHRVAVCCWLVRAGWGTPLSVLCLLQPQPEEVP